MKLSSGRPATCLSGGDFPVLVPQACDTLSIEWRNYGTRIEALAEVLREDRLRFDVAAEYSQRDFSNDVTLKGMVIPGITKTRLNTQVEMKFGQTLLLSGQTSPEIFRLIHIAKPGQESKSEAKDESIPRKRIMIFATPRRLETTAD